MERKTAKGLGRIRSLGNESSHRAVFRKPFEWRSLGLGTLTYMSETKSSQNLHSGRAQPEGHNTENFLKDFKS
jgi:hypothetical protein